VIIGHSGVSAMSVDFSCEISGDKSVCRRMIDRSDRSVGQEFAEISLFHDSFLRRADDFQGTFCPCIESEFVGSGAGL
jgi:hypothetical protein